MFEKLIVTVAAMGLLVSVAPATRAKSNMDFTLVNATGFHIYQVHVSPTSSEDWGSDILADGVLINGDSTEITFRPAANYVDSWDLKVTWPDDTTAYWRDLDLAGISTITLMYNHSTRTTVAEFD